MYVYALLKIQLKNNWTTELLILGNEYSVIIASLLIIIFSYQHSVVTVKINTSYLLQIS
jgi:hypothetical protein